MISLVLVAQSPTVRAGLKSMLSLDEDLQVVDELANLSDLSPHNGSPLTASIDIIILYGSTFDPELLAEISTPLESPPAVLLLSDAGDDASHLSSLPLSAWGLISLDAGEDELLAAVRALYEGLLVAEPSLFGPVVERRLTGMRVGEELVETITPRETEILLLLAQGMANKQIASLLGISAHTVKFHLSSVYSKLGASNRAEAVTLGARLGLIPL